MAKSNDYEIVEQSDDNEYPAALPVAKSVRDALASLDAQRTAMQMQENFGFDESTFGFGTYDDKEIKQYGSREQREEDLSEVMEKDLDYSVYFSTRYGNFDVYFELEDINYGKSFNPLQDKRVEVKIVKKGTIYVASFISPNQIIEELIDGVVSFLVIKVNGQVAKIVGTLKEEITHGEDHVRQAAFSTLPDGRILVWNVLKQKWSSFYPDNLLEMTRDDTSSYE